MSDTPKLHTAFSPHGIESSSMAIIDAEVPEPRPFTGHRWNVVRRLIHTSADFEMLDLVRFSPGAVRSGVAALSAGCAIVTDTEMARMGIPMRRMTPLGCSVTCLMNDPDVMAQAKATGHTRARMAVDTAVERLQPAIFVLGNAPTALLRLMEHIDAGAINPALVVGMPVGFVNAAESKALLAQRTDVPFITIAGRKGGSPLAAACVNALADIALTAAGE